MFGEDQAPPVPEEVPYTQITQSERLNNLRLSLVRGTREIIALAFFVGFVGVIYHLVGFVSTERETLLTQLLDIMGCSPVARLLSWHISFDVFYLLSWLFSGLIVQQLLFTATNGGMVIMFHIIFGFALVSWCMFISVFFQRAQLSGIGSTILAVVLAILAMVGKEAFGNVGTVVLSIIFPPMAFVFGYIIFCNFERYGLGVDMLSNYNQTNSTMLAIFICLIVDIILFAALALITEHWVYGTGRFFQKSFVGDVNEKSKFSLELQGLTKIFKTFSLKKKAPFYAVRDLSLQIKRGEIFCLLGANGSGKSTTLGMIAGSVGISHGDVLLNGLSRRSHRYPSGVLSLCPQKNILWSDLTVLQHIQIWSQIKSTEDVVEDVVALVDSCDLSTKIGSVSSTLSGGMKRKLQLAIAFCGDSQVVLIDEVSSGIDPLARRKLHDIILDARGIRTQILTTHFLDEADLLADRIALLSKGILQAEGVPVTLKNQLGKGYKLNVVVEEGQSLDPSLERQLRAMLATTTQKQVTQNEVEFSLPTTDIGTIRTVLSEVEKNRKTWSIENYDISGPRLEDVFLAVMENTGVAKFSSSAPSDEPPEAAFGAVADSDRSSSVGGTSGDGHGNGPGSATGSTVSTIKFAGGALTSGRETATWEQVSSQLRKRWTIARHNPWPTIASIVVGCVAVGVSLVFLTGSSKYNSSCAVQANGQRLVTLPFPYFQEYVGQPVFLGPTASTFNRPFKGSISGITPVVVDSPATLLSGVQANYAVLLQGGLYFDNSTNQGSFAWFLEAGAFVGMGNLNVISNTIFDNMLVQRGASRAQSTGYRITTTYRGFDSPSFGNLGDSLKFLVFFGVSMCVMYAFASLYPTSERLRSVKALHFSNGLTPFSLHLGHLLFEIPIVAVTAAIITILYGAIIPGKVHAIGLFFIALWLYGIAATLLSFVVALFARSQLAAFAFAAGIQAVLFLLYIVAYLLTLTYAPALDTTAWIRYEHFTISAIPIPVASIARVIIVGLNMFSLSCIGTSGSLATNFGDILLYGGPILYLVIHIILLFAFLTWWDSGHLLPRLFRRKQPHFDAASVDTGLVDAGVRAESHRVNQSDASDVLLVQGVSKRYGSLQAVQDVSFGVARDEVFALLGPNSAGKSTTYGIIRGEVKADTGDSLIDGKSILTQRNAARASLGVCPQFDAMDALTVRQHLTFYARVKGIPRQHVKTNVENLIAAVSLEPFADRLARKLSGGNQRKLSLAIAMVGNPSVLLIDEASSGMDISAKRKIWQTLISFVPGRAVVITTHSMEEADALASRVGIIAKRMLAIGETSTIRRRYGDHYELAIICEQDEDQDVVDGRSRRITEFVLRKFPGARPESDRVYHGHLKFRVPTSGSVAALFDTMEEHKQDLRIQYYGIQRSSLETAFLKLIRQHNVAEEGYASAREEPMDEIKYED